MVEFVASQGLKIEVPEQVDVGFGLTGFINESKNIGIVGGARGQGGIQNEKNMNLKFSLTELGESGKQLGDVNLSVDQTKDENNGIGRINGIINLELSKELRGKGIGSEAVNLIRSINPNEPLKVFDVKKKAVRFWEKLGAVKLGKSANPQLGQVDMEFQPLNQGVINETQTESTVSGSTEGRTIGHTGKTRSELIDIFNKAKGGNLSSESGQISISPPTTPPITNEGITS